MLKTQGQYMVNTYGLKKEERRLLLSFWNVINDQGFENWQKRGATINWTFDRDKTTGGYIFGFQGIRLKILLQSEKDENKSDVWRFYFFVEENGIKRLGDLFFLTTWDKIDDFMEGKEIKPNVIPFKVV